MAVAAQFFYVAAQAGIFSFFINYMTAEVPPSRTRGTPIAVGRHSGSCMTGFRLVRDRQRRLLRISNKGASNLASLGFICFLVGRFTRRRAAQEIFRPTRFWAYTAWLTFGHVAGILKLGWISVACVFLSYFFMSIMFPTIFALGIFGLGARAKKASAFIVMAIMGGAILPKLMGYVADKYDMSRGFIVPMSVRCSWRLWVCVAEAQ